MTDHKFGINFSSISTQYKFQYLPIFLMVLQNWVPCNVPLLTTYGTKKGYHSTYSHYGDTLEAVEIQIPLSNLAHRPKDNKEHAECCPFSVKE